MLDRKERDDLETLVIDLQDIECEIKDFLERLESAKKEEAAFARATLPSIELSLKILKELQKWKSRN